MRGQKLIGFRNFNSSWYRQKETLPLRWNVKKFSELFWSESDWWLSIHCRARDQILGYERTDRKDTLPLPFSFLSLLFDLLFIVPISAILMEMGDAGRRNLVLLHPPVTAIPNMHTELYFPGFGGTTWALSIIARKNSFLPSVLQVDGRTKSSSHKTHLDFKSIFGKR